ncbi:MAG: SoxR reducing system RseC family protein [Oscillospiraceae bacterium]|nr:SoxR reducing system RseC family protein [Oscillospiraceae bacterium]
MTSRGTVKKILPDGRAVVEVTRQSACGHNCAECSSLCGASGAISSVAENPVGARVGETVTIETPSKKIISAAALVYIVPLALLILGYAAAALLGANEGRALIGSLIGFAVGVAVVVLVNRFARRNRGVEVTITSVNGPEG